VELIPVSQSWCIHCAIMKIDFFNPQPVVPSSLSCLCSFVKSYQKTTFLPLLIAPLHPLDQFFNQDIYRPFSHHLHVFPKHAAFFPTGSGPASCFSLSLWSFFFSTSIILSVISPKLNLRHEMFLLSVCAISVLTEASSNEDGSHLS